MSNVYLATSHVAKNNVLNRGMFAKKNISKGSIIEICPVIVLPKKDEKLLEPTILDRYIFDFGEDRECVVLGYGSIYNHSFEPNIHWYDDVENQTKIFYALRAIRKDEELVHNYHGLNSKNDGSVEKEYGLNEHQ
ncbi:SET domain-containing protein-lysine N-methyltransferase [Candidatus Woesebacteria bacterium]|nr:SET domain-containing protein-lysine N-methyltransferase [Candidatus Woesebacteria bacterium]